MTNATATPEATPSDIEKLEAAVTAAEAKVTEAHAAADARMPALTKASNYGTEFKTLAAAVTAADVTLERAQDALRAGRASSVWEQLVAIREPVIAAARTFLVDNSVSVPLLSVRGQITFDDEGQASVTLTPVIGKLDMSEIESLIASEVDAASFIKEGVTSIDLDVTGIGTVKEGGASGATISLMPTSSKTAATRNSSGTRSGKLEAEFNGNWYGSHDLLVALEAAGHQITIDRKQSFDTALRSEEHNGMSNLAKSAIKSLNLPTRPVGGTEAPAETPTE